MNTSFLLGFFAGIAFSVVCFVGCVAYMFWVKGAGSHDDGKGGAA